MMLELMGVDETVQEERAEWEKKVAQAELRGICTWKG